MAGSGLRSQQCCTCTGNSKVLLSVIALFGTITVSQLVAAVVSNSVTLLVDGLSMLVDVATYVGNLCAERRGDDEAVGLLASGLSLAVLYGVALWGVLEALIALTAAEDQTGTLHSGIVLAFGVWGVAFDCLSFLGFYCFGLQALVSGDVQEGQGLTKEVQESPTARAVAAPEDSDNVRKPSMNMRSAFLHVGADFLRSITTVVEGSVVMSGASRGRTADSIATLAVSATILVGGCGAGASWMRQAWTWRRMRRFSGCEEMVRDTNSAAPSVIGSQTHGGPGTEGEVEVAKLSCTTELTSPPAAPDFPVTIQASPRP